ncbi:hypothetical protein C7974DRAFT_443749 [Boeremia exigua]|uniref:uncharacterized protein n=1 Tax=Boeremia exigua TaxID=749465 RepID=UPI001E8E8386|nr:uncharacterized protein C7974DRAFT_443749 [Boeremia exigua]KAH6613861.1 hypothetical protein C7974DRAFT_443749 [Boeremia exigua]
MPQAPAESIANLRDMFRSSTEKIPPDLRRALALLDFTSLSDLEERFLATTAFLTPWSVFRDSYLLLSGSQATEPSEIARSDILWFYTQFDEGVRRHDPRDERPGVNFDIDKSNWGAGEHEKHMYAWMLQTFCVGKTRNLFGFRYFEFRNVCKAWDEVFVPIVKAVRASYSVRGRRHYGRLALFIEERSPSRLAFPEGNISMPDGVIDSPTPFRMCSRPTHLRGNSESMLTKKHYDETERELRDVYPQYGGLVERPIFKQKMDDWLQVQRDRAAHRKAITKPEVVQYVPKYQPQIVLQDEDRHGRSPTKASSEKKRNRSPIKRYSDSIRRSLRALWPPTNRTDTIVQEPKSPLHGVTRQIHIPDYEPDHGSQYSQGTAVTRNVDEDEEWPIPTPRLHLLEGRRPRPSKSTLSYGSEQLTGATPEDPRDHVWSPMGAPSAIPPALGIGSVRRDESMIHPLLRTKRSHPEVRQPSYEGNDYQDEVSVPNLHSRNVSAEGYTASSDIAPAKLRSRLPAPIKVPPPYVSKLRIASNDAHRNNPTPKPAAARRPPSPPRHIPWPGFEDAPPRPSHAASALAPPIPTRSPERRPSARDAKSEQPVRRRVLSSGDATSHEMLRIVSKENIRGALSGLTPDSSLENVGEQTAMAPKRVVTPQKLEAYNTHMFPRKDKRSDMK